MEHNEMDEAQGYIDAVHAQKKRNLVIGVVIVLVLAALIGSRLKSRSQLEYLDEAAVLAQVPALALTEAEKSLAGTILESDILRSALTYEATGVTTFTLEEVGETIAPVVPGNAVIQEIGVQGAVIYIDYQADDLRVILEYVDADRSGTVDRIGKSVAAGGQVYCLEYTVSTGAVEYQKGESWFD